MEQGDIMLIVFASTIISWLILYFVIRAATNAKRRTAIELAQLNILTKIAARQGVSIDEIQEVIDTVR